MVSVTYCDEKPINYFLGDIDMIYHRVKLLMIFLITMTIIFTSPMKTAVAEDKIAGKDRTETAIEISKRRVREDVILVNGSSFSDAISAISLAKKENAAILLNQSKELDPRNKSEISRIQAEKVFIIGGNKVISSSIEEELQEGHDVIRIFGENRFDTNKKVNEYVFTQKPETIIITNASAFADLLSISAYAYQNQIPIIISDKEGEKLDIDGIDPRTTYLVGVEGVLSRSIEKKVKKPIRIAGSNRYETSLAVQESFYKNQSDVFVTTGEHFADALAGVTLCNNGENILLVKKSTKEIPENSKYNFTLIGGRIQNGKGVALYVNPHQDDETLAMGLQMLKDRKDGKEIYIIQMTNRDKSIAVEKINKRLRLENRAEIDKKRCILQETGK